MRCPTLSELPSAPLGKTGWPWTEQTTQLPDTMPDGSTLPKVSIVTPSYNQGQFLEETIRSVLLQGYPDLEYIIVDGGSTDDSVNIIRKYGEWLAYWTSEPDRGQSDAINKGFQRAQGDILGWLNSDDTYHPRTVSRMVTYLSAHPEISVVYGRCCIVDSNGKVLGLLPGREFNLRLLLKGNFLPQPAFFFWRSVLERVGFLDSSLHYTMDYDFWLRAALVESFGYLPETLANFRMWAGSKTVSQSEKFVDDLIRVYEKFCTRPNLPAHIRSLGLSSLSATHRWRGWLHYDNQAYLQAQKHWLKAWALDPLRLRNLILPPLCGIIKTGLGRRLAESARSLKRKLRIHL